MFRHKNKKNEDVKNKEKDERSVNNEKIIEISKKDTDQEKKESPLVLKAEPTLENIKDMLEKNLKWSQILYEQNRKINRKMLWSAIGSWIKILLILVPVILAVFYAVPILKDLMSKYGGILGLDSHINSNNLNDSSTQNILEGLNLNNTQLEQIKSILK